MKLVVTKTNIKDSINLISGAEGDTSNLPILKNFFLDVNDTKIKITATNLEIGITASLSGKIIEKGKATAPLSVFSSLINNLPTERINIEKKGNTIQIKTDNYEAAIQSLPHEEFPLIPKIKNHTEYIKIKSELLKEALGQVLVAAQFSDIRSELNSVLFAFSVDTIKLVATDSFRLAEKTIPGNQFESNHREPFSFIIPLKTCHEVLKVLKEGESVKIFHDEHQILFETDTIEFISRLMEGVFPEYTSIIPKKFTSEAVIDRQEFVNALKLAGVFGSKVQEVKIKVFESKKAIEIFSVDQTIGENKYFLPAKLQGNFNEISFNWRYLLDGLKAITSKELYVGVSEENKPVLIKSPNEPSYFYILAPIIK